MLGEYGNHVVDGLQVLRVHDVVEDRTVIEIVAAHHPALTLFLFALVQL